MTKSKKDIIKVEENKAVDIQSNDLASSVNPDTLISQAIKQGIPVETMKELLAMRKELKAEYAKEQFDLAMANFQKDCPTITKNKSVLEKNSTKARYKFASLDSIVSQVKEIISANGLSYTIKTKSDEKMFTAIVKVAHSAGHSEDSEFSIPISQEQYMSDVQKFGARSTFAKRYAFLNAFGIMTGDEDNDSPGSDKQTAPNNADNLQQTKKAPVNITKPQIAELESELKRTGKPLKGLLNHLKKKKIEELTYQEALIWIKSLKANTSIKQNTIKKEEPIEEIEAEIVEEIPDPVEEPPMPKEELGPLAKAKQKLDNDKKEIKNKKILNKVPEDVCKLVNFYDGSPETTWPEGLKELKSDINSGNFKGKENYPNLF